MVPCRIPVVCRFPRLSGPLAPLQYSALSTLAVLASRTLNSISSTQGVQQALLPFPSVLKPGDSQGVTGAAMGLTLFLVSGITGYCCHISKGENLFLIFVFFYCCYSGGRVNLVPLGPSLKKQKSQDSFFKTSLV